MKTNYLIILISILTITSSIIEGSTHNYHLSPVAAGRGNSFIAGGDTPEATFYNPALIRNNPTWRVTFPSITFMANKNLIDLSKKISDLTEEFNESDGEFLGFFKEIRSEFGNLLNAGFMGHAGFNTTKGGFLFFGRGQGYVDLRVQAFPMLDAGFLNDAGFQGFGSKSFLDDKIIAALTIKYIMRQQIDMSLSMNEIAEMMDADTKKDFEDYAPIKMGSGQGFDLGFLYQPIEKIKLGLSILDIGDTTFTANKDKETPSSIPMSIHTGIYGVLFEYNRIRIDMSFDIRDISNTSTEIYQRLTTGMEASYTIRHNKLLSLRLGLNLGYFTYGAGLQLWVMDINFAYFPAERGPTIGSRPSRFYLLNIALGF